jgi:hypothetical protein
VVTDKKHRRSRTHWQACFTAAFVDDGLLVPDDMGRVTFPPLRGALG